MQRIINWCYIFFIICTLSANKAFAEERGFTGQNDFHIGTVIKIGIPLDASFSLPCKLIDPTCTGDIDIAGYGLDAQFHQLSFWGENLIDGSSLITIKHRPISQIIDLNVSQTTPQPNTVQPPVSLPSGSQGSTFSLTKRFIEIGICSPIYYEQKKKIEIGWQGEIIYQRIEFDEKTPAYLKKDFNSNLGGSIGAYGKLYHLYPYVPYLKGAILMGNFLDMSKFFDGLFGSKAAGQSTQPVFQTGFKTGYSLDAGMDIYLFDRLIIGVSYSLWQLDIDQTQFLNLQGGFLF